MADLALTGAVLNIRQEAADTTTVAITVVDTEGVAEDLSSWTFTAPILSLAGVAEATAFTVDKTDNVITLSLPAATYEPGSSYKWALIGVFGGETTTWMAGALTLDKRGVGTASGTATATLTVDAGVTLTATVTVGAGGEGGASAWGDITGTLGDQTDLDTALDAKAPLASPTFTGTPAAPTAAGATSTTQLATTAFVAGEVATHAAAANPHPTYLTAAEGDAAYDALGAAAAAQAASQPLDADLTALAAAGNSATLAATTAAFLAADETKLDGIEALAEVNDTAAEILTKLLTVDGTGSGLDADLLDGSSAAAFATAAQGALADLAAPLASPALTGTPTAPTAAGGTNTTQLATTAFVTTAVAAGGGGGGATVVRKSADEAITSDVVLTDDSELTFAVGANETWVIECALLVASAGPDIAAAINAPVGSTVRLTGYASRATDQLITNHYAVEAIGTSITFQVGTGGSGVGELVLIKATVVTDSTAGDVALQWCQAPTSANALTLKAGSTLLAHKVV